MLAAVSSVPTKTTTTLSLCSAPIETPEYVATFEEALTPFGFAVCVKDTAICSSLYYKLGYGLCLKLLTT